MLTKGWGRQQRLSFTFLRKTPGRFPQASSPSSARYAARTISFLIILPSESGRQSRAAQEGSGPLRKVRPILAHGDGRSSEKSRQVTPSRAKSRQNCVIPRCPREHESRYHQDRLSHISPHLTTWSAGYSHHALWWQLNAADLAGLNTGCTSRPHLSMRPVGKKTCAILGLRSSNP